MMLVRWRFLKVLWALYPALVTFVVMATANHFWLDAVGGMICLAFGFVLSYAWFQAYPHQLSRRVPAVEEEASRLRVVRALGFSRR
jgi:hypothetical protein